MAYCINCGTELVANGKFCQKCGHPTGVREEGGTREQEFAGKIFKCPNCGEVLNSFISNCPACGYELRGARAVSSVREFALKLEAIEAKREYTRANPIRDLYFGKAATKTDEQKISLIKSFSIPNTKEDLYEFLILASSNINTDMYDSGTIRPTDVRLAVSDAWRAKFDQAYQKARLVFAGDSRFTEIEKLYKKTYRSIKNSKWKSWKLVGVLYAFLFVIGGIVFLCVTLSSASSERKENARLEAIVADMEEALDNKEYKYALMYADSLQCNSNSLDDGAERQWEIQREYWIDKIIEEAAQDGVILERPTEKSSESAIDEEMETSGFVESINDGMHPGLNAAKESINEFNQIMKEYEDTKNTTSD